MDQKGLHLFSGFGIEIEYMIVDKNTLNIMPISDQVLKAVAGTYVSEVELGDIAWSNELVLHVLELKTNGPRTSLIGLGDAFHKNIQHINRLLEPHQACLLPSGAHPWMDPDTQAKLWPHGHNEIYEAYDRIFDCRGHGWSNLQSAHINLPFHGDQEFAQLHTAIRLLLPLIPALGASTPIIDSKITGSLDSRLTYYGKNQAKIPSIAGKIIPEAVQSQSEYEKIILNPMYHDIKAHDPNKILQYEWLNSRGAIARFDRDAIEIRVLDTQESPRMDIAVIQLIVAVLELLVAEKWQTLDQQALLSETELLPIFLSTIETGLETTLQHPPYLRQFGLNTASITAGELWVHLLETVNLDAETKILLKHILQEGNLATRILRALKNNSEPVRLKQVYQQLSNCLVKNEFFTP